MIYRSIIDLAWNKGLKTGFRLELGRSRIIDLNRVESTSRLGFNSDQLVHWLGLGCKLAIDWLNES